jgi:hypothetical protein
MSTALELARAKRAEMKAAGIKPSLTVAFSGDETEFLKIAAKKSDLTETDSVRAYIRAAVFAQAKVDAAKPTVVRTTRTPEQLREAAAKLLERAAIVEANGAA